MATGEARAAAPRDKIAEAHTPKEEESDESARSAGADGGSGDEASSVHDQKARMARWRGEDEMSRLARAFFSAATKESTDNEDILPQEDSDEVQLSVFNVFATCFPEAVGPGGAGAKNKRMRLHFNKIGYQMYGKEQSRRVPAVRAKPGNPGYGFRRARWRDTLDEEIDRKHCEQVLREVSCAEDRIREVKARVQDICKAWDIVRRPSRPAGPGRPRRPDESPQLSAIPTPITEAGEKSRRGWAKKVDAGAGSGAGDKSGSIENCVGQDSEVAGKRARIDGAAEAAVPNKAARMRTPDRTKGWTFKQSPQCNKNAMASAALRAGAKLTPLVLPPLKLTDSGFAKGEPVVLPGTVKIEFNALERLANAASMLDSEKRQ